MDWIHSLLQRESEFGSHIQHLVVPALKDDPTEEESASFMELWKALSSTPGRKLTQAEAEYQALGSILSKCQTLHTLVLAEYVRSHWWLSAKERDSHSLSWLNPSRGSFWILAEIPNGTWQHRTWSGSWVSWKDPLSLRLPSSWTPILPLASPILPRDVNDS